MLIDSHAHLTLNNPEEKYLENLLLRAWEKGIRTIVNICVDLISLEKGLNLALKYPWILNAAAITPHDAGSSDPIFFASIQRELVSGTLIAIGETGLDYHYYASSEKPQKASLIRHFQLAKESKLPVLLHCRSAFHDLFKLADQFYSNGAALLHCFTGNISEAREALDRGWYLSISGIITFPNSHALREVVRYIPIERLLIETDSPYLAPQSKRGLLNEPSYMVETADVIASLKQLAVEDCSEKMTENALRFFAFPKHALSV